MEAPHVVTWYEVNTPDREKSVAFYREAFGWTTSEMDMGPPAGIYTMLGSPNPFAGMMIMTSPEWDGIPPHWMVYFGTADYDATVAKIEAAGGKVAYGPMDVPGVGRIGVVQDDQGCHFSIHQPESGNVEPPDGPPPVTWIENQSPDREKSNAFYTSVFGWSLTEQDMGEFGMYSLFAADGKQIAGAAGMPPGDEHPAAWLIYFYTPDLDASLAKVQELGATVLLGAMDVPDTGRIAVVADNVGAVFGLHQPS